MLGERLGEGTPMRVDGCEGRRAGALGVGAWKDDGISLSQINRHGPESLLYRAVFLLEKLWWRFMVVGCKECGRHFVAARREREGEEQ